MWTQRYMYKSHKSHFFPVWDAHSRKLEWLIVPTNTDQTSSLWNIQIWFYTLSQWLFRENNKSISGRFGTLCQFLSVEGFRDGLSSSGSFRREEPRWSLKFSTVTNVIEGKFPSVSKWMAHYSMSPTFWKEQMFLEHWVDLDNVVECLEGLKSVDDLYSNTEAEEFYQHS